MKLGIYCRISRIKDGNDLSIGDQSQKGIDKANELGIDYEMYIDEGISGASESISDRPQFERLLGDISAGDITHVFCYDQSRLERNPQMRFVIVDLFKKKNITFITAMGGVEDLNDPQQEFFGDLLSVINKFHVTTTKIKVKSALKLRVGQGKTNGIIPYGYAKGANDMMVIDADESVIVKRIFNMSLSGIGTPTIAETLNKEGVPTRYAKIGTGTLSTKDSYQNKMIVTDKKNIKWSPNTVYSIVRNPIYKGIRTYGGVTLAVAPIFDAEYFDRVQFHLKSNIQSSGKKVEHRYLLKGLLRCSCGCNMYGFRRADKSDNHYVCSSKRKKETNCGNRGINIDKIDDMIWNELFYKGLLSEKIANVFDYDKVEIDRIRVKISEMNKVIDTLKVDRKRAIDLVIKGVISEDDIESNLKVIDGKINESEIIINDHQQKMFALENSEKIVTKYQNEFESFTDVTTFSDRQKIVQDFISDIWVTYIPAIKQYSIKIDFKVSVSDMIGKITNTETSWLYEVTKVDNTKQLERKENLLKNKLPQQPTTSLMQYNMMLGYQHKLQMSVTFDNYWNNILFT